MEALRFKCTCRNPASKWIEQAPHSTHRYRVECATCGRFIKWGPRTELEERVGDGDNIVVKPHTPGQPPANLRRFFDDD